jgi:hypothetical protein
MWGELKARIFISMRRVYLHMLGRGGLLARREDPSSCRTTPPNVSQIERLLARADEMYGRREKKKQ